MAARDWIATTRLLAVDKRGRKRRVAVRIGEPYRVTKRDWACPVDSGILGRVADARGGDSFQAICLAISLTRALVEDFLEKGGRFLDPDDGTVWPRNQIGAIFGWKQITLMRLRKKA